MTEVESRDRKLLLISNSTLYGGGYLDHAEKEIRDFLGAVGRVLLVPFAQHDRDGAFHIKAAGLDLARPYFAAKVKCATIGDLKLALKQGLMTKADVHAELGEVIAGRKPGRENSEEVIVFDSTGTALQDVAAAANVYEKAQATDRGILLDFAE